MKKQFTNIQELIKNNLNIKEDSETQEIFNQLKNAKKKGCITKKEFMTICMWKSPRPKQRYVTNSENKIISTSKQAFSTKFEKRKIELLTSLNGVSIPTASAILTIVDPKNYGIIDIRVWQTLYLYNEVKRKPTGIGFKFNDWYSYLMKLRYYAKKFNRDARTIEKILFEHHKNIQKGNLYKK